MESEESIELVGVSARSGPEPASPAKPSFDFFAFKARVIQKLAELVEIYLPQAANSGLVEKTSPKDALSIVKSALELMSELSSGSLLAEPLPSKAQSASCPPLAEAQGSANASEASPASPVPLTVDSLKSLLNGAVDEIAQMELDTKELAPWARLLVRCNALTEKLEELANEAKALTEASISTNSEVQKPESKAREAENFLANGPKASGGAKKPSTSAPRFDEPASKVDKGESLDEHPDILPRAP